MIACKKTPLRRGTVSRNDPTHTKFRTREQGNILGLYKYNGQENGNCYITIGYILVVSVE